MNRFWIYLFICLSLLSCTRKEPVYSTSQIMSRVLSDPNVAEVFISEHEAHLRVVCESYGAGCIPLTGKRLKIRGVDLLMIQFETPAQARAEALRLNQWYARNWLLDDVQGEPILESFVQRVLEARRP